MELTQEARQRVSAAIRKRWALWTPKQKQSAVTGSLLLPVTTAEVKRQPCTDPTRCSADAACPFPPVVQGRCRQHARDAVAEESTVGTAHGLLVEFGMVEHDDREKSTAGRKIRRRQCCTSASVTHKNDILSVPVPPA